MKQRLSALLDGELEATESRTLLSDMQHDPALRAAWNEYRLMGDALRAEPALPTEMVAKVMAALEGEPVILAPRPQGGASWRRHVVHHPALALAASVSGVAVVAWLAFAPQATQRQASGDNFARVAASPERPFQAVTANDMRGYPVAHRPRVKLVCLADEK